MKNSWEIKKSISKMKLDKERDLLLMELERIKDLLQYQNIGYGEYGPEKAELKDRMRLSRQTMVRIEKLIYKGVDTIDGQI